MRIAVIVQDGILTEWFADDAAMAKIKAGQLDVVAIDIDEDNADEPAIVSQLLGFDRIADSPDVGRFLERLTESGEDKRAVCAADGQKLPDA